MQFRSFLVAATAALAGACSGEGDGSSFDSNSTTTTLSTSDGTTGPGTSTTASGSDTDSSASASGGTGDKFDVNGATTGAGTTGDCESLSETSMNKKQPADIIMVVDNSGSMDFEANFVQNNLNGFSQQIINSGIDVHVVLISSYPGTGNGICIGVPLGSGGCPAADNQPPLFTHIDDEIGSNEALEAIIVHYDEWKDILRPDSARHFVVMSDDNSDISGATKNMFGCGGTDAQCFQMALSQLDVTLIGYKFHAIVSPFEPFLNVMCAPFAAAKGQAYIDLVNTTGGVLGDLCSQMFAPVFDELSTQVIAGATLGCSWDIPDPPNGLQFDKDEVNVQFDDGMGNILDIGRVDDPSECPNVTDAWYYDDPVNPTQILLCPQTCTKVQGFMTATIDIQFGCETKPAG